jgi:hypothetical protein
MGPIQFEVTVFQTSEQVTALIQGSDLKIPDRERAYQSSTNNSQPIKLVQPGSQSGTSRMKRGIRGRSKIPVPKLGRSACWDTNDWTHESLSTSRKEKWRNEFQIADQVRLKNKDISSFRGSARHRRGSQHLIS